MASGKRRLIEEGKSELERLLEERIDEDGMTLDEIEAVVEKTMREVASWVEKRLIAEQQPPETNLAPCPQCQQLSPYKRIVATGVLTIHGLQPLHRRYHYCGACREGFSPLDAALGLEPGREATRQVRAWEAKYGSEGAFAAAAELLQDLRGLSISASTIERTTLEVGEQLRATKVERPGPEVPHPHQGQLLPRTYLSMDGTMLPLRDPWKRDGTEGKLHCRYGEAKIGIVFQTDQREGLDTRVLRRECISALGELSRFVPQLESLAWRWRLPAARDLVILGDGAPWIWNLAAEYFPHAVEILDFWHLTEHLWKVARARHEPGSEAARKWVRDAQWDLQHDLVQSFLQGVREWVPHNAAAAEVRRVELEYFTNNAERMRYGTFVKRGYMIGSGVMESGNRQIAKRRLAQAGMHWRQESAEAVVAVRAHLLTTQSAPLTQYA